MHRGLMVGEDWYAHLAATNRRIVEAREHIEHQKALIRSLMEQERSTSRAAALLRLFEETLQVRYSHRENILEKVRKYQLPVCDQHGLRCGTQAHCDSREPGRGAYTSK